MLPDVCVVGHPFGPLGTARAARCSLASFHAAAVPARVYDVWQHSEPDLLHARTIRPHVERNFGQFNLFHLNGDEIESALEQVGGLPVDAVNVIYPMWELSTYPARWARLLEGFDEVWAASRFILNSVSPQVRIPVTHMPLATEVRPANFRSRRYFGIPEAHYVFLFSFDLRAYVDRKNPSAVLDAFDGFLRRRPMAQASLVVKVHGSANAPEAAAALEDRVRAFDGRVVLLDRLMQEDEVQALIYNCDAFVSLHRSEGYGLGLAEAMALGKPTIATAYSGNTDFMSEGVSYLVPFELIPVPLGAYPESHGQVWAEPDVKYASRLMTRLYDDPVAGRRLGRRASQHMLTHFSFRAGGLRYRARLMMLMQQASGVSPQRMQLETA